MDISSLPPVGAHVADYQFLGLHSIFSKLKKQFPHIDVDQLQIISSERVVWNDGSLGCPIEGWNYTQALVPGFCIFVQHRDEIFELHTDNWMNSVAMPGIGFIPSPGLNFLQAHAQAAEEHPSPAIHPIFARLKNHFPSIDVDKLQIISSERVVWNNSALGCEVPGGYYLQVLTPGSRILIQNGDEIIEVHTSKNAVAIPGIGFI